MITGEDHIAKHLFHENKFSTSSTQDLVYYCDITPPITSCYCWCNSQAFYNVNDAIVFAKKYSDLCHYIVFTNIYCPVTKLMKAILVEHTGKINYYDLDKIAIKHLKDLTSYNTAFNKPFYH